MRFEPLLLALAALTLGCSDGTRADLLRRRQGAPVTAPTPRAKLINSGRDLITGAEQLSSLGAGIAEVETQPFDGLVLDLGLRYRVLTSTGFDATALAGARAAYQAVPFQKLTDNFQVVNVDPGDFDWFDDIAVGQVASNLGTAATLVASAGLTGIAFDLQPYGAPLWHADSSLRPFSEYQALLEQRGRLLGSALFDAAPTLTVLLNVSVSELFRSVCLSGASLSDEPWGLLPSFLDGFLQAATDRGAAERVIDGFIGSYPTRDPRAFDAFYALLHGDRAGLERNWLSGIVSHRYPGGLVAWDPEPVVRCDDATAAFLTRDLRAGFGLMMDYDYVARGGFSLDEASFTTNYFEPATLEVVTRAALVRADTYVWIWSETVDWWGNTDLPPVPTPYVQALADARVPAP